MSEETPNEPSDREDERRGEGGATGEPTETAEPAGPTERPTDERIAAGIAERLSHQIAVHWTQARAERLAGQRPLPIEPGASDLRRARVPYGIDLAAAWAWRFLVIGAALLTILWLLDFFMVVTLPLAIALLIAALAGPAVHRLHRLGLPRGLSTLLVMVCGIGVVALLLTFVGQQVAQGASDLADSVVKGLGEIRDWLRDGPLKASDSQINSYLKEAQDLITERSREGGVLTQVTELGTAVGHLVAGFFIVIFATYFFMADGDRIWSWFVRLAPRAARERVDSSGRVAWGSLTSFVRATLLIALVDSIGVMIVAAILGVPFVLAIGVLVFLGAFVPMVGATVAGGVAVLVALVDQGPWTALWMLVGVIAVQQIEGHGLQPFVMGRFVSVHPLGVIVAIAVGVIVAGVPGALLAVPLVAVVNAVVLHLADWGTARDPAVLLGIEEPLASDPERG